MTVFNPEGLIAARARKRLTQQQLADLAGIAVGQVNRYECRKATPKRTTQYILADALGISVSDLTTEEVAA